MRAYELESKVAIFPRIVIDPAIIEYINQPTVHAWKYDGDLPIVDTFSLIHDNGNIEETAMFIREAIMDIYKTKNENTIGKLEWIITNFNQWCTKNNRSTWLIKDVEKSI